MTLTEAGVGIWSEAIVAHAPRGATLALQSERAGWFMHDRWCVLLSAIFVTTLERSIPQSDAPPAKKSAAVTAPSAETSNKAVTDSVCTSLGRIFNAALGGPEVKVHQLEKAEVIPTSSTTTRNSFVHLVLKPQAPPLCLRCILASHFCCSRGPTMC